MDLQLNRLEANRVNVGDTERQASLATGLAIIGHIVAHRPKLALSLPLGLGAGYLVYRGATGHCLLYDKLEITRSEEGNKGIQVERAITINKPRDELYRIWRKFENLPRFMTHLRSVRTHESDGRTHSHWIATAPLGKEIEWDAEVTEERQNEMIAWRSSPGSLVKTTGSVHFNDAPGDRGTIVKVNMQYTPPAGSMGAAFAKLFGKEPSQQIHDDLHHFKEMMETGEMASVEGQTSGRNENFGRSIAERQQERDVVTEASMESFPASDAPSWTASKGV